MMFCRILINVSLISLITARPAPLGLSSGLPGAGISGDRTNGATTLDQELNLNNAPALEKIRENQSLADIISPRKLTDMGIGITSDRLGVLPPSNVHGQSIGGHVSSIHSGFGD